MALVRSLAYVLLSLALVAAALMIGCFVLALLGIGNRPWSSLALPLGAAALFLFGVGVALARTVHGRDELDRAIHLLHRDIREALTGVEADPSRRLDQVLPSIGRFQRAARETTVRPRVLQDLVDLFDYEQQHDRARAEALLQELDRALTAVETKRRVPRSPSAARRQQGPAETEPAPRNR